MAPLSTGAVEDTQPHNAKLVAADAITNGIFAP
jgi:hypothetical protein